MLISLSVNAMLVLVSITASKRKNENISHAEGDYDLILTTSEEGTLEETTRPSATMERRIPSVVVNSKAPSFTSESHEAPTPASESHAAISHPSPADGTSRRDKGSQVPIVTSEFDHTTRGGDVSDSLTTETHAVMPKFTHSTSRSTDSIISSTSADIPASTSPNIAVSPPEAIITSAHITDTSTVTTTTSVSHTSTPLPITFTLTTSNFETISEQQSSPITIPLPPLTLPPSTHSARTQLETSSTAAKTSHPFHTTTAENFIRLERNSHYQKKRDDDGGIMVVLAIGLLLILLLILILAVLITAILVTKNQRKRKPVQDAEKRTPAVLKVYDPRKRPRLMRAADMSKMHFEYKGALVLQPKLKGPIRNDCEDVGSLHSIKFDPNLNEVVDIGSNVEVLNTPSVTTEGGETTKSFKSKKNKTKTAIMRLSRTKSSKGKKKGAVIPKGPEVEEAQAKPIGQEGTRWNADITPIR